VFHTILQYRMLRRHFYNFVFAADYQPQKWQKCLKRFSIFLKSFVRENKQRPSKSIVYTIFVNNTCTAKCINVYIKILYFIYVCLTRKNSLSATDFHCCAKRGDVRTVNKSVKNYASYDVGFVIWTAIWIPLVWELFVLINRFSSRIVVLFFSDNRV